MIRSSTQEGYLNVYSVEPAMWGQWEYIEGIDVDSHNSEINRSVNKGLAEDVQSIWKEVHESFNVWKMKYSYWDVKLRRPALKEAAKIAFGA